jgi:ABC-type histidine transport system ATPase subunit
MRFARSAIDWAMPPAVVLFDGATSTLDPRLIGVVAESGLPAMVIGDPREEATRQFLGRFKATGSAASAVAPATASGSGEV